MVEYLKCKCVSGKVLPDHALCHIYAACRFIYKKKTIDIQAALYLMLTEKQQYQVFILFNTLKANLMKRVYVLPYFRAFSCFPGFYFVFYGSVLY